MSTIARQPLLTRIKPFFAVFDIPLSIILALLMACGLLTVFSAGYDFPGRFIDQFRNFVIAFAVMWVFANITPQNLMRIAVPMYIVAVILLIGVALFGITRKGSQRWLSIGITVIQPSELMKIAMPLMIAWYFHQREMVMKWWDFVVAALLLFVPTFLVFRQPDLGTSILVFSAGFFVIFFAGLSWKLIVPAAVAGIIGITALVASEDKICQPEVKWPMIKAYQKQRVCTLLDPTSDPLGSGFHIIQSEIAIGSGGLTGKGYMQGTQTHLEFIPERTTDFIFAVYAEEWGLAGAAFLLILFMALFTRGLMISLKAPSLFGRLMAGALTMILFVYALVNMGMVTGLLPVVGVPLPFMSYGGTALVTIGCACGMLMSIANQKQLVAS